MKRYLFCFICLIIFSILVFSSKTVEMKTELVFQESEESETTIISLPNGFAIDDEGNIYISDSNEKCIKKFGPDGKYIMTIGRRGAGPGEFVLNAHIQVLNNQIIVTEFHRVQVFALNGNYIKSWKLENPRVIKSLKYFKNTDSYICYLADLMKSRYVLELNSHSGKSSQPIISIDAGRNARIDSSGAYLLFTVLYYFDIDENGEVIYAGNGENTDLMVYKDGKSSLFYKIKGTPTKLSNKELEQIRIQRETIKNFDIPDLKYNSIIRNLI